MITQKTTPNQMERKDKDGKVWIPDVMVYHIADGTYTGTISWAQLSSSFVSSHFVIAKDGRITQLVPLHMAAYTQGLNYNSTGKTPMPIQSASRLVRVRAVNPNCYCISIEFEGFYADFYSNGVLQYQGCKGAITEEQITAAVEVEQYCNEQLKSIYGKSAGIPADREHHMGHCEINPINRPHCPGELFPYDEILNRIVSPANTETKTIYRVQTGAFSNKANAEKLAAELQNKGYQTIIKSE
ncbi:MAG: hypothetical protein E7476_07050 [Ruminococcaceae bacterium]|jgi:N-acetyl-anhydromuramyl-L-alanine amidase AmpD|nr:hypothetical protein [Oscillospiraceae bacterium]